MTSRTKALVYSLGAPVLYSLLQIVTMMSVLIYLTARALSDGVFPTEQADVMEFTVKLTEEVLAFTLPTMLAAGVLLIGILMLSHRGKPFTLWNAVGLTKKVSSSTLVFSALAGLSFHVACQGFIGAAPVPPSWEKANEAVAAALIDENNIWISMLMICVLIPFVEEVVFRGFTQRILHHAFLPWTAVAIQGVIFGVFHANALQTIYAFATGLLIGYIYMKTQNLWATVFFHMAYNSGNLPVGLIYELTIGEDAEPGALALALMAAGGVTLTLLFVRSIKGKEVQKAIE